MMFNGGKTRLGLWIVQAIQSNEGIRKLPVLEPFVGSAAVTCVFSERGYHVAAGDKNRSLCLMWQSALAGDFSFTGDVSEDEYAQLKQTPGDSPRKAFAGFGCSFGGKWFAGYARDPKTTRNYASGIRRSVQTRAAKIRGRCSVTHADFMDWTFAKGFLIYCDPPYANTTCGFGSGNWDSRLFWLWAEYMAQWNQVYVSEYQAPKGWACVMQHGKPLTMDGNKMVTREEKLFYKGTRQ